jgi:DNA-damage-inducible protein J
MRYNEIMAAKTEMIHARVDPKLKKSTEEIFSKIGLTTTEAIRLFLTQVRLHRGLPFPVSTPNQETIKAMREVNDGKGLKEYRSFRELRNRL